MNNTPYMFGGDSFLAAYFFGEANPSPASTVYGVQDRDTVLLILVYHHIINSVFRLNKHGFSCLLLLQEE